MRQQLPGSAQPSSLLPLRAAKQLSDSRPPFASPCCSWRSSCAMQPKPPSMTSSSLRGLHWRAQAGANTLLVPCVICCSLFHEGDDIWRFHAPNCREDSSAAACCNAVGVQWMHHHCYLLHVQSFRGCGVTLFLCVEMGAALAVALFA